MGSSINMGQLIPLRLQPSPTPANPARRISLQPPSPPPSIPLPSPANSILRPRPGPVSDLTIFPYTEPEWREVMEEVNALYLKHKYKQCSVRCIQILNSIKDPYQVHPLYQAYLSFFAASSLEETSRSLHINSSAKLLLLQQSLTYYQNVESHMEYASFSADPTIVQAVRQTRRDSISSNCSSVRSSIESIFSNTSLTSAASSVTSPISSVCSETSERSTCHKRAASAPPDKSGFAPLKTKKKVSFSLQLPRDVSEAKVELTDDDSALLNCFPSPPSANSPLSPPLTPEASSISDFLLSQALNRYRAHLTDLHPHINQHIRSVEHQIAALQKSRKAWQSNLPTVFAVVEKGFDGVGDEERRKVELRARVERLKERGWKRERFDGRRYEVLCQKALGDLDC